MKYIIGTRGSKLALVQTELVIKNLKSAYPQDEFIAKVIKTTGDMDQKRRLDEIGSKGIFVKEIEDELLDGTISMAVHSMKDMPDEPAEGLIFAKAWKREDPRDVLILKKAESLDELPYRAVIGTGSKRRAYQISAMRPDLKIVSIRGNVDTRIRKLKEGQLCEGEILDGIVIAAAGIKRIGRADEITQYLSCDEMIPAPAQGTLAIELKADNLDLLEKLNALSDEAAQESVDAERGFLKQIGGNCHLPVAAYCDKTDKGPFRLRAMFGTDDGSRLAFTDITDDDTEKIVERAVEEIRRQLEK